MVKASFFTRIICAAICTLSLASGAAAATLYAFEGSASWSRAATDLEGLKIDRDNVSFRGKIALVLNTAASGSLAEFSGLTLGTTTFGTENTRFLARFFNDSGFFSLGGGISNPNEITGGTDDFRMTFSTVFPANLVKPDGSFVLPDEFVGVITDLRFANVALNGRVDLSGTGPGSIRFTRIEEPPVDGVVPLPAGIWLGLTGLLALGALRRRDRRG